jgi:hypothetical protein
LSDLCIIRPSAGVWVENARHVLPIGRCESREIVGSLCRGFVPLNVVDGITIAPVSADGKPEEAPHDDF